MIFDHHAIIFLPIVAIQVYNSNDEVIDSHTLSQ